MLSYFKLLVKVTIFIIITFQQSLCIISPTFTRVTFLTLFQPHESSWFFHTYRIIPMTPIWLPPSLSRYFNGTYIVIRSTLTYLVVTFARITLFRQNLYSIYLRTCYVTSTTLIQLLPPYLSRFISDIYPFIRYFNDIVSVITSALTKLFQRRNQ